MLVFIRRRAAPGSDYSLYSGKVRVLFHGYEGFIFELTGLFVRHAIPGAPAKKFPRVGVRDHLVLLDNFNSVMAKHGFFAFVWSKLDRVHRSIRATGFVRATDSLVEIDF